MYEYKTSDFNLACYLTTEGLSLKHVEGWGNGLNRCSFVLLVPTEINLVELLQLWDSQDTDKVRKLLQQAKKLKSEIKNYFSLSEK